MANFRVSGTMDEIGYVQVDLTAQTREKARIMAIEEYGFKTIISITEL